MKQPGVLLVLITFVAAVSFVVASDQFKNGRMRSVPLTGQNEATNPGDPDGTGMLKFAVRADEGKFCYDLSVSNISLATTVTLNLGAKGSNGQQVTLLKAPSNNVSADCVSLDADRLGDLARNPANYYVNVQTADFPNGALRGQLK
ncbi:MAG TPA: CHRD domain-containing protein [Pyrinomonadaceae bacterium]